jgi:uncharacterized protein
MRLVIAGASGFLGTWLQPRLRRGGYQVVRLVRREARGADEVSWDPAAGRIDAAALAGAEAVINLAGAGVADRRWTERYKRVLLDSRVQATGTLARAMAKLPAPDRPRTFLTVDGINYYGDTGDRVVDETAPSGDGFLAGLCREWEAATRPAEDAGVRVLHARTGTPLHQSGGYLKPQMLPFRLGLGGKLGHGRQWMPWISLDDWLEATVFLLERDDIAGPVNVVAPEPVRNAEFTKAFGAALHRPTIMPVPGFALRIALGELSVEALASVRAVPGVLLAAGFTYRHADIADALRAAVS